MRICAGIVLYKPDIIRLNENIEAISSQVDELVLVDNTPGGGFNGDVGRYPNVHIIINNENLGIGKALNQILDFANSRGYGWFITIDQDSVCDARLVEKYKKQLDDSIGQITCNIQDRSLGELGDLREIENPESLERPAGGQGSAGGTSPIGLLEIESCITSGCVNNTEAIIKVGGYDEGMFIDGVDIDISLKLRKAGYRVTRLNYEGLTHSLGDGKQISILGKKLSLTRHAPWRSYYMRRNFIYIARKYYTGVEKHKAILKQIGAAVGTIVLENKKAERIKYCSKGLIDGFKMKVRE